MFCLNYTLLNQQNQNIHSESTVYYSSDLSDLSYSSSDSSKSNFPLIRFFISFTAHLYSSKSVCG